MPVMRCHPAVLTWSVSKGIARQLHHDYVPVWWERDGTKIVAEPRFINPQGWRMVIALSSALCLLLRIGVAAVRTSCHDPCACRLVCIFICGEGRACAFALRCPSVDSICVYVAHVVRLRRTLRTVSCVMILAHGTVYGVLQRRPVLPAVHYVRVYGGTVCMRGGGGYALMISVFTKRTWYAFGVPCVLCRAS